MKADVAQIFIMRGNGCTYKEIASNLGISKHAVGYHLNPKSRAKDLASSKKYWKAHPDEQRRRRREWRIKNPTAYNAMKRRYYAKHRDAILERNREYKKKIRTTV